MSINDSMEKINPVVDFGDARSERASHFAKTHYRVKQFFESEGGKDLLIILIVILVGLISFELGRLSKNSPNEGIKVEYPNQDQGADATLSINSQNQSPTFSGINNSKSFFASSRGQKYYPLGCSAGKSIKEINRIYFTTREEAEKAGYELSSSCRI